MTVTITYAEVSPMIPMPVPTAMIAKATAWCTAVSVLLDQRYGALITAANRPLFVSMCADAITRRLVRPSTTVTGQGTGPSNVRYSDRAPLGGWFNADELATMDATAGLGGGVRTVRAPAPDSIRFGNLSRRWPFDTVDETGEGDEVIA